MRRANIVKPVVRVYCLPKLPEDRLQALHKGIVATAVQALDWFAVKNEQDLLVLFPPDSMEYGLGSEILVEVDLPMHPARPSDALKEIACSFGQIFKEFFPDSFVQCTPYRFDPENSWTS